MTKIELVRGDITKLQVDAIVNAANRFLLGGGGVDGAIHLAAGPRLLEECKQVGTCPPGEARITKGYELPANYVIHSVGPVFQQYSKEEACRLLKSAYFQSLKISIDYPIQSIGFPNISTGVYGFPKKLAAIQAIKAVDEFITQYYQLQKIIFCCFDEENYRIYQQILESK